MVILIIILCIFAFIIIRDLVKQEKITHNTVICFTGGLGAGKTYMGVKTVIKKYRSQKLKYKLCQKIPIMIWFMPEGKYKPTVYSNIPIKIEKDKLSNVLLKEHLLMKPGYELPEKAILFIDEIGAFASQWDYDNPLVMENLSTFMRLYRHFTGGYFICTDQTSDNIVKPIRSRINVVYNLNDFRRILFLPFGKVDVHPLEMIEDSTNSSQAVMIEQKYFMFFFPYKWMKSLKYYESRVYKYLYTRNAKSIIDKYNGLTTEYLIDLCCSNSDRQDYKKHRTEKGSFLLHRFDE